MEPSLLYSFLTVASGAAVGVLPLVSSYAAMALLSSVYGFAISANYTLVPVILVNLISLDNFTGAYGLLLLIQGLAGLMGPPIAGKPGRFQIWRPSIQVTCPPFFPHQDGSVIELVPMMPPSTSAVCASSHREW